MITPKTAFEIIFESRQNTNDVVDFLRNATAKELEDFLLQCRHFNSQTQKHWTDHAKTALQLRIGENAAEAANRLIQHTEKLTQQTDIMVRESRKLGRLTWGLLILTAGLLLFTIGLLVIDWHRDNKMEIDYKNAAPKTY
jgi:hypothetical protein